LIVDEIAMGFCKTGRMFAYEHAGIDPDIVCVGKALSAGYLPISAALVRDQIYETFDDLEQDHTFYHGHTFAGNPIAVAAAEAALDVYEEERLWRRAREIGGALRTELAPLASHHRVRGLRFLGAIAAVEFNQPEDAWSTLRRLIDHGILARPLGPVLYLIPPLISTDDQIHHLAAAFRTAATA
jgi:adenosylmethionine-8-amino-7-oxononanoate aminotransferase